MRPGVLSVVATPLGNLEDITPRALAALRGAALVACEDTRRTRGLLAHFGIRPPRVISCHKFNEKRQVEPILSVLREGGNVALVSDGGTPGLSDPGAIVVDAALQEGLPVSPVPGPSAVSAAVSVCGFPASSFVFHGFLPPRSAARRRAVESLRAEARPIVFFEAPHRVAAAVADLLAVLGDRPVTMFREMTKLHEETRRTSLSDLAGLLERIEPRGEFTLVVAGAGSAPDAPEEPDGTAAPAEVDPATLRRRYQQLLDKGVDRREALKRLVRETGLPRSRVYDLVRGGARQS